MFESPGSPSLSATPITLLHRRPSGHLCTVAAPRALVAAALLALASAACGSDGTVGPDVQIAGDMVTATPDAGPGLDSADTAPPADVTSDVGADTATPDGTEPFQCEAQAEVPCIDQSFQDLGLFETVNPSVLTDESVDQDAFVTHVDTSAGGMTATESFVYVRFTDDGLEKLEISDDDAFSSTDWDLGLRRFVIRTNSGVSGPSCVTAARTVPDTAFDGLTTVPDELSYRTEEYFTGGGCAYVSDGSGIGSPGTALASFWTYPGCVQMTGNVYVIQRADGRHVKLQVLSYYEPTIQQACQDDGALPSGVPSGAGNVRLMWAFLD